VSQQRVDRVSGEVRAVVGEILARDEIKDPRVRGAGLITVTHVRISGDLRYAHILFTVHGLDGPALERVRAGLDHASGYFRQAISRRLRTKASPAVTFEVDQVFDQASKLESLLRELGTAAAAKAAADAAQPAEEGTGAGGDKGNGKGNGDPDDDAS